MPHDRLRVAAVVVLTAVNAASCGGEIEDAAAGAARESSEPRDEAMAVRERFGASASHDPAFVGEHTVLQLEVNFALREGRGVFAADGSLTLHVEPRTPFRVVRYATADAAAPTVWCALGSSWRTIDEERLGLLFECKDGLPREVVLRRYERVVIGGTTELALESVGGERVVGAPSTEDAFRGGWVPTPFALHP